MNKKTIVIALVALPAVIYAYSAIRYLRTCGVARPTCLEHRLAGCSVDGEYSLTIAGRKIDANCDMKSDQGGWTLVGNYLHAGGKKSTSRVVSLNDRLPTIGSSRLGADETGTPHWGHAGTFLLSSLPFREVRFACRTSAHSRRLDIAVSSTHCLEYFRTGKGSCFKEPEDRSRFVRGTRTLLGHDAFLPARAEKGWSDQAEGALVNYPFFQDWKAHWAVGTAENRWECDDYERTGAVNTWHQIWVR